MFLFKHRETLRAPALVLLVLKTMKERERLMNLLCYILNQNRVK